MKFKVFIVLADLAIALTFGMMSLWVDKRHNHVNALSSYALEALNVFTTLLAGAYLAEAFIII